MFSLRIFCAMDSFIINPVSFVSNSSQIFSNIFTRERFITGIQGENIGWGRGAWLFVDEELRGEGSVTRTRPFH